MMIRFNECHPRFDRIRSWDDVSFEVRPGEFAFLVGQDRPQGRVRSCG